MNKIKQAAQILVTVPLMVVSVTASAWFFHPKLDGQEKAVGYFEINPVPNFILTPRANKVYLGCASFVFPGVTPDGHNPDDVQVFMPTLAWMDSQGDLHPYSSPWNSSNEPTSLNDSSLLYRNHGYTETMVPIKFCQESTTYPQAALDFDKYEEAIEVMCGFTKDKNTSDPFDGRHFSFGPGQRTYMCQFFCESSDATTCAPE